MAWIRSEQSLERNPKKLQLQSLLEVESDVVIGRLHRLWWWCLDYALDGDLRKHDPKVIEAACNIPLELLKKSKFVDSRPSLRIHDWWDYVGNYLKMKYKDHPEKWRKIELSYCTTRNGTSNGIRNTPRNPVDVEDVDTRRREDKKDTSTNKEMEPLDSALPSPRPKGATAKPRKSNGHLKNCTCEVCWKEVAGVR